MVTLSAIELMEVSFVFASCIRGHHISKAFWTPTIGETLCCEKESGNAADPYAVAVVLSSEKAIYYSQPCAKKNICCQQSVSSAGWKQHGVWLRGEGRFTSRRYKRMSAYSLTSVENDCHNCQKFSTNGSHCGLCNS